MAAPYTATIGLEVHAELVTKTKMFCDSRNDPDETRPNVNTCPVCLAHPGTLPTINREAVHHILRVGTAVGGTLADFTEFDRKSYFYPDIPKGYQISQYEGPLVSGGSLNGIAITRIHLEEDTARSSHASDASLVDFNRAGIPLMELVTEPVIHDAETAGAFARELQLLLRTLGVGNANLEKGEMRIEANISVSNTESYGTKVEVKNINSFRSVERAIAHEIERQIAVLEKGEKLFQETRGWDETKQVTFHQRFKEGSADYRYFPEPDLPKLIVSEVPEFSEDMLKASMPELPWNLRSRYHALGISVADTETFLQNDALREFFSAILLLTEEKETLVRSANYLISDVTAMLGGEEGSLSNISAESFLSLMRMIGENTVSSRGGKDILARMFTAGGKPEVIAKELSLFQVSDEGVLLEAVQAVLKEHAGVADEYRAGKESSLQFLVGQAMRATKGAGNPGLIRDLLVRALK